MGLFDGWWQLQTVKQRENKTGKKIPKSEIKKIKHARSTVGFWGRKNKRGK